MKKIFIIKGYPWEYIKYEKYIQIRGFFVFNASLDDLLGKIALFGNKVHII